jgi:sugar phosphate permease
VPAPPLATPGPHASDAVAYIVGGAALVFVVGLAAFVASFTGVFAAAAAPAAASQGANVVRYHLVRTSPEPDTAPPPSQQQHRRHGRRG